jgi:hypothetical protein
MNVDVPPNAKWPRQVGFDNHALIILKFKNL